MAAFNFLDEEGKTVATASQSNFSWGVKITIYDAQGAEIGSVHENILKSAFSTKSHYSIKDAEGNEVASSEKLDFFGTSVEIKDASGNVVAIMKRSFVTAGGDSWDVNFTEKCPDRRLFVFIPCYKSYADNHK